MLIEKFEFFMFFFDIKLIILFRILFILIINVFFLCKMLNLFSNCFNFIENIYSNFDSN